MARINSEIVEWPEEEDLRFDKFEVEKVNDDQEEFDAKQIVTGYKLVKLNMLGKLSSSYSPNMISELENLRRTKRMRARNKHEHKTVS